MKCTCYKCKAEVPEGLGNHFTSEDGRILCEKCSVGVKAASPEVIEKLKRYENMK